MQILVAFYTLGSFRWQVLLLAAVSFPIYTRALVNAIFRRDQKWHVTGQKGAYRSPFAFMMPQVLFFQFLLITTVVGVWKDLGNGYPSLAVAWNATNTLILGGFVLTAWREGHHARAAVKAQRTAAPRRHRPCDRTDRTDRRCRMTWTSRLRLLAGTMLVLVIAALATYQLNETRGVAASDSAQILAKSYSVGTPYAGLVVDQLVDVGDAVTAGQPLFVIDSATLQYDVENGFARTATEATQIDAEGRLVVLATGDGVVTEITGRAGHLRAVRAPSWRPCSAPTRCTCRPSTRSRRRSTHGWRTTPP